MNMPTTTERAELIRVITHLLSRESRVAFSAATRDVEPVESSELLARITVGERLPDPDVCGAVEIYDRAFASLDEYQARNGLPFSAYWDGEAVPLGGSIHVFLTDAPD